MIRTAPVQHFYNLWKLIPLAIVVFVTQAMGQGAVPTPPDAFGAAGSNHVMSVHNSEVVIQTKAGEVVYRSTFAEFWIEDAPHIRFDDYWGGAPVDGRVHYDPYYVEQGAPEKGVGRWIVVAVADPDTTQSSLLVAVSQSNDPTGDWHKHQIANTGSLPLSYPNVGFNGQWIAVHCVMTDFILRRGRMYVLEKEDYYTGGTGTFHRLELTNSEAVMCPATTYDPAQTNLYLLQIKPLEQYPRIGRLTGPTESPSLELELAEATVPEIWGKNPVDLLGFVSQIGGDAIVTYHEQLWNVLYQNDHLWFSQQAYLPVGFYNRVAVQWW